MMEVLKMPKVKLGDIAKERREVYNGDKSSCPVVGLEHLTPGGIRLSAWDVGGDNTFSKAFFAGDVLFGRRRAYLKKAAQATVDGLCSGDITVIQARADRVSPDLLPFIIQNDAFFEFAVENSAGSLSPRVKWEHLANYEIDLPSMDEQRKLASLLWVAYELKESYERLLRASDEMAKSRFIEMFENYPRERFGDFCSTHARIGWQKLTQKEFLDEGDYYLVTGWDIMPDHTVAFGQCKYVSRERYEQDPKLMLSKGDVLLTKDGTLGKVAIIDTMKKPATLNGHIFVIRPKDGRIIPEFLIGLFTSADFIQQMESNKTGSTIVGITQKAILEFQIPVAPVEAQRKFVRLMQQLDKSKVELQKNITSTGAMIKSLLSEAVGE